jgi:hypothetical protein
MLADVSQDAHGFGTSVQSCEGANPPLKGVQCSTPFVVDPPEAPGIGNGRPCDGIGLGPAPPDGDGFGIADGFGTAPPEGDGFGIADGFGTAPPDGDGFGAPDGGLHCVRAGGCKVPVQVSFVPFALQVRDH